MPEVGSNNLPWRPIRYSEDQQPSVFTMQVRLVAQGEKKSPQIVEIEIVLGLIELDPFGFGWALALTQATSSRPLCPRLSRLHVNERTGHIASSCASSGETHDDCSFPWLFHFYLQACSNQCLLLRFLLAISSSTNRLPMIREIS